MKIRIRDNSIRYRLTKSEVNQLWSEGGITAQTSFPGTTLHYAIERCETEQLHVDFKNSRITLYMSKAMIDALYHTDKVGFEDKSGPVGLLIEKDFVCLDNTSEDQSDNYPNPNMVC